ncbi:MAG: AbrB/MazE/SpoVT family DNA-binding domain-containing protein [Nanoarchaeota archaeon]|nr:AbrB/MazE/SpoVT family DNA-binding domain-containing protein [Nanoarchaeota archaeon]
MGTEIIEMGSISSRGQIAIPSGIRKQLGLNEGSKVLFILQDNTLIMKKVTAESFASITEPLRKAKKKIKEDDVVEFIHAMRKK